MSSIDIFWYLVIGTFASTIMIPDSRTIGNLFAAFLVMFLWPIVFGAYIHDEISKLKARGESNE